MPSAEEQQPNRWRWKVIVFFMVLFALSAALEAYCAWQVGFRSPLTPVLDGFTPWTPMLTALLLLVAVVFLILPLLSKVFPAIRVAFAMILAFVLILPLARPLSPTGLARHAAESRLEAEVGMDQLAIDCASFMETAGPLTFKRDDPTSHGAGDSDVLPETFQRLYPYYVEVKPTEVWIGLSRYDSIEQGYRYRLSPDGHWQITRHDPDISETVVVAQGRL